jgi:hypothetical protein
VLVFTDAGICWITVQPVEPGSTDPALGGFAAMQQIADWLEKLGMSKYAERFTENKIDVPVLRHSTDQRNHNVFETNGPFWKTGFVLWVLALCGVFLVLPYVATLENKALAAAAAHTHLEVGELLAISVVQTAILLAIAVILGQWAARKLGLGTPLIAALLAGRSGPERLLSTLLLALALGISTALALMMLDHWVFAPIPAIAELIHNAESGSARPSAWQGFLASFYGAVTEEILMRLGFLSLLALAFRTLARMCGANREITLPIGVFWAANIVTAVLFGLGHLPATAAIAPLSVALVVRAIVLNGTAGLVFGALYRRYGLEWAMTSHFGVDIVAHVAIG